MSNHCTPIMLAPNGARRTQSDHPAVPVTIDETLNCALEAKQAGAHALHAHVRDANQRHLLCADAYAELLRKADTMLGQDFPVQITTEYFGIYSTEQQIQLIKTLKPKFASVALREIIRTEEVQQAHDFYHWCLQENVGVQHILYDTADLDAFFNYQERDVIPAQQDAILMVVGRYTDSVVADTSECARVVDMLSKKPNPWMLCAFGQTETDCLKLAADQGGGVRVGFENSVENANGEVAANNVERVIEVAKAVGNTDAQPVDTDELYRLLGAL